MHQCGHPCVEDASLCSVGWVTHVTQVRWGGADSLDRVASGVTTQHASRLQLLCLRTPPRNPECT